MHIKRVRILMMAVLMLASAVSVVAQGTLRAGAVLDKAVGKINSAKAVDCAFGVVSNGKTVNGTIVSAGKKFKLATPQGTTWYDGSKMWTANPSTREITLVQPTDSEVRESNPFAYIDGYKNVYNAYYSKRKDDKRYLVVLNPKNPAKADVKAVEIAINKKTFLPERFIIRDKQDRVTTINITRLTLQNSVDTRLFSCPVGTMTDYELIDLQ